MPPVPPSGSKYARKTASFPSYLLMQKMASSCADNILVIVLLHYVNFVIVISHCCTCICSTNHGHTKLYSLLGKFSKIKFTKSWSFICHSYNDN